MTKTRSDRARSLDDWAEQVNSGDLKVVDTRALRTIAELADRRDEVDDAITAAVLAARQADRSWSEIGTMLGVSKQAAQQKYSAAVTVMTHRTTRPARRRG